MTETYLFVTSMCPKCPEAKEWMKKNNVEFSVITADKDDIGMDMANMYGIRQVPTILVLDKEVYKKYNFEEFKTLSR